MTRLIVLLRAIGEVIRTVLAGDFPKVIPESWPDYPLARPEAGKAIELPDDSVSDMVMVAHAADDALDALVRELYT